MTQKCETQPGEAGLADYLSLLDNRENVEKSSRNQVRFSNSRELICLKHLAARLHSLGLNLLFYFLREIEGGADLRPTLEDWGCLRIKIGGVR